MRFVDTLCVRVLTKRLGPVACQSGRTEGMHSGTLIERPTASESENARRPALRESAPILD